MTVKVSNSQTVGLRAYFWSYSYWGLSYFLWFFSIFGIHIISLVIFYFYFVDHYHFWVHLLVWVGFILWGILIFGRCLYFWNHLLFWIPLQYGLSLYLVSSLFLWSSSSLDRSFFQLSRTSNGPPNFPPMHRKFLVYTDRQTDTHTDGQHRALCI